jgi:hypothetical protein
VSAVTFVLRQRDKRPASLWRRRFNSLSQGWRQRPRRQWRCDGRSRTARDEDGLLAPPHGRSRRNRRGQAPSGARRSRQENGSPRRLHENASRPESRSRPILRGVTSERNKRRRSNGDAQAFSESWSLQFYHYDVPRWLKGDKVPPPEARNPAVTPDGATSIATTSSQCRISGNTFGMLRGISLFTAWFSPIPTRRWRRISCCLRANGTCIRTASCRPTNGTSAM